MVICPSCQSEAVETLTQYGPRHDCCGLWSWGGKPLVGKDTHEARKQAHYHFDKLWKSGWITRTLAYQLLSEQMCLSKEACHIALMSNEQALKVVHIIPLIKNAVRKEKLCERCF